MDALLSLLVARRHWNGLPDSTAELGGLVALSLWVLGTKVL